MTTSPKSPVKPQPPTTPVGEMIERPIKPFLWGSDHWTTFAYIETRCIDYGGVLNKEHMRTDVKRHLMLVGASRRRFGDDFGGSKEYPTRLHGGLEIKDHDDWDCLLDMEAAGLLVIDRRTVPEQALFAEPGKRGKISGIINRTFNPKVQMTNLGAVLAGALRAHKAGGGSYKDFVWNSQEKK